MPDRVPEAVASERLELSDLSSSNDRVEITAVDRPVPVTEGTSTA
jgi:hypothetical protein